MLISLPTKAGRRTLQQIQLRGRQAQNIFKHFLILLYCTDTSSIVWFTGPCQSFDSKVQFYISVYSFKAVAGCYWYPKILISDPNSCQVNHWVADTGQRENIQFHFKSETRKPRFVDILSVKRLRRLDKRGHRRLGQANILIRISRNGSYET